MTLRDDTFWGNYKAQLINKEKIKSFQVQFAFSSLITISQDSTDLQ